MVCLNNARKKTGVSYFRYKQRTSRTSCILDSHADVFIGNILARVNLLLRHRFYTHVNMLLYDAHIMKNTMQHGTKENKPAHQL